MIYRLAKHGYARSLTVVGEALAISIGFALSTAGITLGTSLTIPTSEQSPP